MFCPIRYKKIASVVQGSMSDGWLSVHVSRELATNLCKCSANAIIALQVIIKELTSYFAFILLFSPYTVAFAQNVSGTEWTFVLMCRSKNYSLTHANTDYTVIMSSTLGNHTSRDNSKL